MEILVKNNSEKIYSKPQAVAWMNNVENDFRRPVRDMMKLDSCYYLSNNRGGFFYGCAWKGKETGNVGDTGILSATFYTGKKWLKDSTKLVQFMKQLMADFSQLMTLYTNDDFSRYFADKNQQIQEIEKYLTAAPNLQLPPLSENSKTYAYREYKKEEELIKFLNNPIQKEYGERFVFLVDADKKVFPSANVDKITSPISRVLTIKKSADGFATAVKSNDDSTPVYACFENAENPFCVKYSKSGFEEKLLPIKKMADSYKYLTREGNEITLKSPKEAGWEFEKDVTIEIIDNKETGKPIEGVSVTCGNLSPKTDESGIVQLKLKEGENKVTLGHKNYESSEGFKISVDAKTKNYTIKMTKLTDNYSISAGTAKVDLSLPKGEKLPPKLVVEKKDKNASESNSKKCYFRDYLLIILFALGLAIGCAIGHYLWKTPVEVETPQDPAAEEPTENQDDLEKQDVSSLNAKNTDEWTKYAIKSNKYKEFLEKELIEFTKPLEEHPEITNKHWKECYDLYKQLKENVPPDSLKNAVKSAYDSKDGKYSLKKLKKNLEELKGKQNNSSSDNQKKQDNNNSLQTTNNDEFTPSGGSSTTGGGGKKEQPQTQTKSASQDPAGNTEGTGKNAPTPHV